MREILICIIIVSIIISLDVIMQNYTKKSTDEVIGQLEKLNEDIKLQKLSQTELKEQSIKIKEKWQEKNSTLAYYIEHNELEKVETDITSIISYIETGEYNLALDKIEVNIFILKHIKDKYQLSLANIF
ncbi:MAG: DUF4363 family protein [Clostridia bacterium]|nr:DUF4363 family protein [Clostridia bacterium]